MRKVLASLVLCLSLSMVLMVPAFAETTTGKTVKDGTTLNGATVPTKTYHPNAGRTDNRMLTNTGTYNGTYTGTTPYGTNYGTYGTGMAPYGTGTGTYGTYGANNTYGTDGNYGAYDGTRMNAYRPYHTTNLTTRANNTVRRLDTAPARRGFSWGWLGLIGLFGLAGMRSRSRDDVR
ncbi:WGxxGxxG family protein [Cohnella terricola]|uniref:MYXO-CTERM domain-containing protein n=1 Tax=Cohnella terricola TaxID=1289167 RepID=A0A559JX04_9BACL|nr:WGxxGxxG family protein [Cohnella terricola]TVY04340.1 hypothetical protein FPZ45_01740 [Cohnella terricola]